ACFCRAEVGIRDRNVTGVQTCALPIFLLEYAGTSHVLSNNHPDPERFKDASGDCLIREDGPCLADGLLGLVIQYPGSHGTFEERSEERRVGKESSTAEGAARHWTRGAK